MTQPTPYVQQNDYSDELTSSAVPGVHGAHLDQDFQAVIATLNQILTNLAILQRDDTALANNSVHPDALNAATKLLIAGGWVPRGAWATSTVYAVGNMVTDAGNAYVCVTAHTSGVLATDIAAGKWSSFYSATLAILGALTPAADRSIYYTSGSAASLFTLTAFARTLLDDADAATALLTIGAAALASPAFTGTPSAPTAAADTNTTQLATAAFVLAQAASLAEMEAAISATKFVTPARQHAHPSAAKGWGFINTNGSGTTYNMSSVGDDGAGVYTANWGTDFSSSSYASVVSAQADQSTAATSFVSQVINGGRSGGATQVATYRLSDFAQTDPNNHHIVAFGDQ